MNANIIQVQLKIYTQNINVPITDKILPLTIRITNSMQRHGDLDVWKNIMKDIDLTQKNNFIYFNFYAKTNEQKRNYCYEVISSKNIIWQNNLEYNEYLKLLCSFKYCICPEGNGLDTHRFWECLYLKVIPITLKNFITEYYSKIFPVILLNKQEELDIDNIENHITKKDWNNYYMLDFDEFKKTFEQFKK